MKRLALLALPVAALTFGAFALSQNGTPDAQGLETSLVSGAGTSTVVRTTTVVRTATVGTTSTPARTPTVAPATVTPSGGEGCTPGFWKTHTDTSRYPNAWPPTGHSPSHTVGSIFTVPFPTLANESLLDALQGGGGPTVEDAAQILLRAAVAGLLDSSHPDINYPRTTAGLIADVNAALATGDRSTILALAGEIDADNNLGCPISGR